MKKYKVGIIGAGGIARKMADTLNKVVSFAPAVGKVLFRRIILNFKYKSE